MSEMRMIEIDFEVHQQIELERTSFAESPNDALRRLLKLGPAKRTAPAGHTDNNGRPWAGKGVTLPHGTEVQMDYNGKVHAGRIENGEWAVEGKRFKSPSAAAGGVAVTKSGGHTKLDGWIYWRVKRPGDARWIAISELKPR